MILGEVTPDREPVIRFCLVGADGQRHELEAVVDTGFTDYLTLPRDAILAMGYPFRLSVPMVLGDGTAVFMRVHDGRIEWSGQERVIPVHEVDGAPLMGMSLLHGSRLTIDIVDGGPVRIEPLP
jgi:clan AA aspartic protease